MEFGLLFWRSLIMARTFFDSGLSKSGSVDWKKKKKKGDIIFFQTRWKNIFLLKNNLKLKLLDEGLSKDSKLASKAEVSITVTTFAGVIRLVWLWQKCRHSSNMRSRLVLSKGALTVSPWKWASEGRLKMPWMRSGEAAWPIHRNMECPFSSRNKPESVSRSSEQRTGAGATSLSTSMLCWEKRVTHCHFFFQHNPCKNS